MSVRSLLWTVLFPVVSILTGLSIIVISGQVKCMRKRPEAAQNINAMLRPVVFCEPSDIQPYPQRAMTSLVGDIMLHSLDLEVFSGLQLN